MEAELKAALDEQGDAEEDGDFEGDNGIDYNLIKNFLESFGEFGDKEATGGCLFNNVSKGDRAATVVIDGHYRWPLR